MKENDKLQSDIKEKLSLLKKAEKKQEREEDIHKAIEQLVIKRTREHETSAPTQRIKARHCLKDEESRCLKQFIRVNEVRKQVHDIKQKLLGLGTKLEKNLAATNAVQQ